ncbi:hypothetical protein [Formosimonas limnophila]|uniref:hypothetical protein n=1 Tax=Formosimonas limnophila TaxID=1384487 RepID=UPI00167A956E|nr:hypothetical protein [Formosimonas limnophila]
MLYSFEKLRSLHKAWWLLIMLSMLFAPSIRSSTTNSGYYTELCTEMGFTTVWVKSPSISAADNTSDSTTQSSHQKCHPCCQPVMPWAFLPTLLLFASPRLMARRSRATQPKLIHYSLRWQLAQSQAPPRTPLFAHLKTALI